MILVSALLAFQAQPVDTTKKTTLAPVNVEAEAFKPARYNATTKFDEFYRRKARGNGKFFTREDLERTARTEPAYMLQGIGGIRVIPPKPNERPIIRFNRCPMNRVTLFINGMESTAAGASAAETLFEMHVNDIEAMEVYTSPAQLPQEAMGSGCAAIFIWTRYTSGSVLADKSKKERQVPARQQDWPQHSMERPQPAIVTPTGLTLPVPPPEGAVVLFDGTSLSGWRKKGSDAPAGWKVENGYMEVVPGAGDIASVFEFGDARLHVEFLTPTPPRGSGQDRGNSGVFLMGMYEVQVLDSYQNTTYPDGQNAALYGDVPPAVNASLPPGQWQSYDISFRAARFDEKGKLLSPTLMTVYHNGVKVHDNVALRGPTANQRRAPYVAHPARLPLSLQDHEHPVRYRNIWVKEL
jgi:hypothetical protein